MMGEESKRPVKAKRRNASDTKAEGCWMVGFILN
jgi:hypothetical protein